MRLPEQLAGLDGLIIPGGESTTIGKLAVHYGLMEPLRAVCRRRRPSGAPAPGRSSCPRMPSATSRCCELMDITVERNAFGRQVAQFRDRPGCARAAPG